ncbi:MAG: hypothetical protein ACK4QP_19805, partial [Pseudorhizobium sp.]
EESGSLSEQSALLLKGEGQPQAGPLPTHLSAVEEALIAHGKGNRLVGSEVLHALQKKFGHGFGRFVHEEVAPGLIKLDLITRKDGKWIGLFPRISYERTARGTALAIPLQRLVADVERIPSLIDTNPTEALDVALSAGVLLVMSARARRQITALRKLLTERGDDFVAMAYMPLGSGNEGGGEIEDLLDLGGMALSFDVEALLDSIEAVGDFTSGGDSSSSDAGDGGGGGD